MAGHNKWSKIKHKKAVTDAQKSKVFGKFSQAIAVESKKCGGDVNSPSLKSIIDQAKAMNMPAKNIEKAVSKGLDKNGDSFETITYEAYGPGGVAILIMTITDNKNRTAAEVRHCLTKNGYSLGTPGSVLWAFDVKTKTPNMKVGITEEELKKLESLVELLLDLDDVQDVITNEEV